MKEKKTKKPFYKRWWFVVLIAIIIIGAIGGGGSDEAEEIEEKQVVEVEETKDDEVPEVNQEELEELFLGVMKENFEGLADVEYDNGNKTFTLLPTDDDLVHELMLLSTGDEVMLEGWGNLVDGVLSMSQSLKENIGNGYTVQLLNPANTDNVLLICVDGAVVYDVADDL